MEARYLFLFELLGTVDLNAIKNSFIGKTLPLTLLPSPHCRMFIFLNGISVSLCQLPSFYWHGVWFTVSISLCSLCLSFHPVSIPLSPLSSKNLAWNWDRRAPAVFLTHSSSLKSKPTEAKSGYYLSCVSPLFLSSILLFFFLKVYEILHFEKKGQPLSQADGCELDSKGDCCINKEDKINAKVWDWCLTGCVFVCICSLQTLHFVPLMHTYTLLSNVVLLSGLLWSNICDFFTAIHLRREINIDHNVYQYGISERGGCIRSVNETTLVHRGR